MRSPAATQASPHDRWPGFLHANRELYLRLVKRVEDALDGPTDGLLAAVSLAARAAAEFHPGLFADGAIENHALLAGERLSLGSDSSVPSRSITRGEGRRVLHVATQAAAIGGHTRMIQRWASVDTATRHSLAVLHHQGRPVPDWLVQAIEDGGGDVFLTPPQSTLSEKALWLRQLSYEHADLVVLHHDPADVVPTAAFAVCGGPPVARVNIADHQFWLGAAVADFVISLRTIGAEHARLRRGAMRNVVLPVPLEEPISNLGRADSRRALGIPAEQIVLLTVGRAEKYRPCGSYDFVDTCAKILSTIPEARLYVVGESLEGISPHLRCPVPERMQFVGPVADPTLYRAAADVYLESFPFGSQTALLESALMGLPVVPAFDPLFPMLVANDDSIAHLIPNPPNEAEYIDRVVKLALHAELRGELGECLRTALLDGHVKEGWADRVSAIYEAADGLEHAARMLPRLDFSDAEHDIGLSFWHAAADGRNYNPGRDEDAVAMDSHSAYVARYIEDYPQARRAAWRALRGDPSRHTSWRLFIVSGLGGIAGRLRLLASKRSLNQA